MTHDTLHVTHGRLRKLCKNVRSLALMVWDLWCHEDLEEKDESFSELINDRGVCRTAPATPGLFKINISTSTFFRFIMCGCLISKRFLFTF